MGNSEKEKCAPMQTMYAVLLREDGAARAISNTKERAIDLVSSKNLPLEMRVVRLVEEGAPEDIKEKNKLIEKLKIALFELEQKASIVAMFGSTPGTQWVGMSIALVRARQALLDCLESK